MHCLSSQQKLNSHWVRIFYLLYYSTKVKIPTELMIGINFNYRIIQVLLTISITVIKLDLPVHIIVLWKDLDV